MKAVYRSGRCTRNKEKWDRIQYIYTYIHKHVEIVNEMPRLIGGKKAWTRINRERGKKQTRESQIRSIRHSDPLEDCSDPPLPLLAI